MGVTLFDKQRKVAIFSVNFWHWHAILEAIRSLGVLPAERIAGLHEPFVGDLTESEARLVSEAIRDRLLPTIGDDERLLLDGRRTTDPPDTTFYRDPVEQHRNYSTNRKVLEEFAKSCQNCAGF